MATTFNGIYLLAPSGTAGNSLRIRKKAAPATPYTITVAFLPLGVKVNFENFGMVWRQSSDGKLINVSVQLDATLDAYVVNKWTSPTAFSASYVSVVSAQAGALPVWLRMTDDGANRIVSVSSDGEDFLQIHSVGRTDFLTADEVGFYVDAGQATWQAGMTLVSWKQT